jgi:hypothetical protein
MRIGMVNMLSLIPAFLLCICRTQARLHQEASTDEDEDFFHFVTRPDIGAPKWNITLYDEDALAPGYWFLAPYANLEQTSFQHWNGPHVYDTDGDLVWSGATFFKHLNAFDFRVTQVAGEDMLSVIVPHSVPGSKNQHVTLPGPGDGDGFILDDSYHVYRTIDMHRDIPAPNMHDLTIADDGSRALMLTQKTYEPTSVRVGAFNRPCKIGWQGFREVDLRTGELVFDWSAEGHIDPYESTKKEDSIKVMCQTEWDILHLNAIDKFDDGDYLLSARHANTLYKVSHKDGSIVWRLGGSKSDFQFLDEKANFTRQHHARFRGQNETHTLVSLFNNAMGSGHGDGEKPSDTESSGLLLALRTDTQPMTVEIVSRYAHPEGKWTPSRGSLSFLPNGNAFVGWVFSSLISEHASDGRLLMKAILPKSMNTYRAYKFPWIGRPSQPPDVHSVAVRHGKDRLTTRVHVSWNGATEVAIWELLHTNAAGNVFESVASLPRQGFETALSYDGFAEYVVVLALDASGNEIGRSKTIKTTLPSNTNLLDISVAEEAKWQQDHIPSPGTTLPAQKMPEPSDTLAALASNSSHTPTSSAVAVNSTWFSYAAVAFGLGFLCCLALGGSVWLLRRARVHSTYKTRLWRSPLPAYAPVRDSDDEDMGPDEEMLEEKALT